MNSMAVQWLGLSPITAKGPDSVPGWGTNIPQDVQQEKKKREKEYRKNKM